MLVGLQGAGKTTTAAKIAKRLTERNKAKVLDGLARRQAPRRAGAARGARASRSASTRCRSSPARTRSQIASRAESVARLQGYDVVMLDTAGRTHIDEPLMAEMAEIRDAARPHEILLVADALTGQDAVNLAKNFNERVGVTGIVLTRVDGDGRGGAALSMRAVTGKPIKLLGVGEKMDALEDFHPERLAGRILGMGDIVCLVEKAAETIDMAKAAKMAEKMRKGVFDLDDLSEQLAQIEKMGGMGGIMGMLPGMAKMKDQIGAGQYRRRGQLKRQRAIIGSMTAKERRNPHILNDDAQGLAQEAHRGGRRRQGRGRQQAHQAARQMADMMKAMGGAAGKRGMMGKLGPMMGMGGGCRPPPSRSRRCRSSSAGCPPGAARPAAAAAARRLRLPPQFPGLPGSAAPKLPGLGGFNPFPARRNSHRNDSPSFEYNPKEMKCP